MNQEEKLNITITLRKEFFVNCSGIFAEIYAGKLTHIVQRFQEIGSNDILQLVVQTDEIGRTPLDIACQLGFKNIVLYLLTNMGSPSDVVHQEINVDTQGRNLYHLLCYKGNYECLIQILNIERCYLKKTLFDQLYRDKQKYRFKNMDIKHGHLVSTVFHDADTIKRHEEFNIRVQNLFEQYARDLINKYRQILCQQDSHKRNPIHYGAMSKYTKCFKCIEALLNIDIDIVEGYNEFLSLFFELQLLENTDERKFDPRKYNGILEEFKHLLAPKEYNSILKDFQNQIKFLLKEILDKQDENYHSPLHVASYYGDFKASRFMIRLGADPNSPAFAERPLEVGKDKFTRGVLQNLNDAAFQSNVKDLKHLVNCGNKIDNKLSIFGEAPIHKAVLAQGQGKNAALRTIIENKANVDNMDSNGWTALHHAAYNGDFDSAQILIQSHANVNSYSNQQKTPLHFAAFNDHYKIIQLLLANRAEIEWMDEQKCTPLHLACKKGHTDSVALLLANEANIYAQDFRLWTPLHYAAYNGHKKVCNYLLKWEADKDVLRDMKNSQFKKPINISKNPETKKGFKHIWRACRDGELDLVRILIREGQDMNEQTQKQKNTPLHIAARHGHFLIVKYLIENGANPTIQNKDGHTAFDFAEDSKRQIEVSLPNNKSKLAQSGFDLSKIGTVLDKLSGKTIVLASASVNRKAILEKTGLKFEISASTFEEDLPKENFATTKEYVVKTSEMKLLHKIEEFKSANKEVDIIITADTIISLDETKVVEKPEDKDHAFKMLKELSEKGHHEVYTSVWIAIMNPQTFEIQKIENVVDCTKVYFEKLDDQTLWNYIESREPFGKAGGYGIQGQAATFISKIEGDFYSVWGFPFTGGSAVAKPDQTQNVEVKQQQSGAKMNDLKSKILGKHPPKKGAKEVNNIKGFFYLTERIMIAPFPDEEQIDQIAEYLNEKHQNHYLLYNLSEHKYDNSHFQNSVMEHSFPGLPSPPLDVIFMICSSMSSWLQIDPDNIIVIHCQGTKPLNRPLILQRIIMYGIPDIDSETAQDDEGKSDDENLSKQKDQDDETKVLCAPYIQLFKNGQMFYSSLTNKDQCAIFDMGQRVENDFLVRCRHFKNNQSRLSMFRASVHTSFVVDNVIRLTKNDLDGACNNDQYPNDFFIDLIFIDARNQSNLNINNQQRLGGRKDDKSQPIVINKSHPPEEECKIDLAESYEEEEKRLMQGSKNLENKDDFWISLWQQLQDRANSYNEGSIEQQKNQDPPTPSGPQPLKYKANSDQPLALIFPEQSQQKDIFIIGRVSSMSGQSQENLSVGGSTPSSSSENKPKEEDTDSYSKIPFTVSEEPHDELTQLTRMLSIEEQKKIQQMIEKAGEHDVAQDEQVDEELDNYLDNLENDSD